MKKRSVRFAEIPRCDPAAVSRRWRRGEVLLVDIRSRSRYAREKVRIAGSLRVDPRELRQGRSRLPDDRELVLYCNCKDEATSASTARFLQAQGFERLSVLEGGLAGWMEAGLPVVEGEPDEHS